MAQKRECPLEDDECIFFHHWLNVHNIPHAHIANESRSGTKAAMIRGAKLKRMGQSAGVWDYEIYVPIYGVTGNVDDYQLIRVEMKRKYGGVVSPEQKKWQKIYETAGIPCKVCKGSKQAIAFVEQFIYNNDDEVF